MKPDLREDKTELWLGSEHEVQKLFEFLGKVASRELTLVEAPELVEITMHNLAIKFALSCCLLEGLLAGAHEKEQHCASKQISIYGGEWTITEPLLTTVHLWRHVLKTARETRYSIAKVSRIRKITKFEAIIRIERDILGMNISMNDLILVASPNGVH